MNRRIFGFQRRVWWPKWTPASSSCFMVTTATRLLRFSGLVLRPRTLGSHFLTLMGECGSGASELRSAGVRIPGGPENGPPGGEAVYSGRRTGFDATRAAPPQGHHQGVVGGVEVDREGVLRRAQDQLAGGSVECDHVIVEGLEEQRPGVGDHPPVEDGRVGAGLPAGLARDDVG